MADKNGGGIVYHRSDCGSGYVRMYGSGGDWPEVLTGGCEKWALEDWQIDIIHKYDWNFKAEDLNQLKIYRDGDILGKGKLSPEEFQLAVNYVAGCHTDVSGNLLNDDGSRQDGKNPQDSQGFYLAFTVNGRCPDSTRRDCPENHTHWESLSKSMRGDMSAFGGGPETWKATPYNRDLDSTTMGMISNLLRSLWPS
jgi:hypothetical protein